MHVCMYVCVYITKDYMGACMHTCIRSDLQFAEPYRRGHVTIPLFQSNPHWYTTMEHNAPMATIVKKNDTKMAIGVTI